MCLGVQHAADSAKAKADQQELLRVTKLLQQSKDKVSSLVAELERTNISKDAAEAKLAATQRELASRKASVDALKARVAELQQAATDSANVRVTWQPCVLLSVRVRWNGGPALIWVCSGCEVQFVFSVNAVVAGRCFFC